MVLDEESFFLSQYKLSKFDSESLVCRPPKESDDRNPFSIERVSDRLCFFFVFEFSDTIDVIGQYWTCTDVIGLFLASSRCYLLLTSMDSIGRSLTSSDISRCFLDSGRCYLLLTSMDSINGHSLMSIA